MRLSIKYKLILIILLAISLVAVSAHLIGQWSFQRGFIRFVNITEQARLSQLATDLQDIYAEQGSWETLLERPIRWMALLRGNHREPPPPQRAGGRPLKPPGEHPRPKHREPPPEKLRHFEARVVFLDAQRQLLFGFPHLFDDIDYEPLQHEDTIVGYLGLAPQKQLADLPQLQFVKEQRTSFGMIALSMVLLAALLTLPITERMVRPVKTLAAATREMTHGNYKVRTPVTSEDELGQLSRDFNVLAETLEKNEQARRQWVADISHELRTPLAVMRGEIEALQDKVREITPQALKSLHAEIMQLNRLVNDLYELSMSDLGALTYKKELIAPVDVLENTVAQFQPRIENHKLKLTLDLSAGLGVHVLADPDRMQQLSTNLLENSLRYTEQGGRLEIRSERSDRLLTFHVLDSAPGVPDDDLSQLFDRLYRVESSRNRAVGGAGLGLSICRNIVEAHGGDIEAKPSPYGGLWLIINMPLNR